MLCRLMVVSAMAAGLTGVAGSIIEGVEWGERILSRSLVVNNGDRVAGDSRRLWKIATPPCSHGASSSLTSHSFTSMVSCSPHHFAPPCPCPLTNPLQILFIPSNACHSFMKMPYSRSLAVTASLISAFYVL